MTAAAAGEARLEATAQLILIADGAELRGPRLVDRGCYK